MMWQAVVGDLAIGTTPEGWLSIELFPLVAMVGWVKCPGIGPPDYIAQ